MVVAGMIGTCRSVFVVIRDSDLCHSCTATAIAIATRSVGKSTLFNALTETQSAEAANYPFCTIEPNVGIVSVPDPRLKKLGEINKSVKIVPATLEFVDVAGLIKGASAGEGLGNQFLTNIRNCDAIVHVVRCFENDDVIHVDGTIDPVRDAELVRHCIGFCYIWLLTSWYL